METSGVFTAPTSMEDVERLIQALYAPSMPANVYAEIQSYLVPLQRNAEGWRLAEHLLQQDDPNVKFFGVSTYIVKMNSDWDSLDEEGIMHLEANLFHWLITLYKQPNAPRHVVNKLSTALALYYSIGKGVNAGEAVKTMVCSSLRGEYMDRTQMGAYSTSNLAPMLDSKQINLVLQFIDDLASEGQKLLSGYPADIKGMCVSRMAANLEDAVLVIQTPLFLNQTSALSAESSQLCNNAMLSFHALVNFGMAAWARDSENIDLLRTLIEPALVWCANSPDLDPVSTISELLDENRSFFRPSHLELIGKLLDSPWANEKMELVLQADPDVEPFLFLLVAFGQAMLNQLVTNPQADAVARYLDKMHAALTVCDNPGIDEEAGPRESLPFWAEYLDLAAEKHFDEDVDDAANNPAPWLTSAKTHVMSVADTLARKIQPPPPERLRELDSASVDLFKDFRRDVQDFWQEAYRFIGDEFLQTTLEHCIAACNVPAPNWAQTEAALYCLNGMADEISPSSDTMLDKLFSLPLFASLSQARLPQWTCRTALDTVTKFSSYFQRRPDQLPAIFEFLFVALQSPVFANPAATSIYNLCDNCRSTLHPYLARLIETYQNFLSWETSKGNTHTKEKFIGAIACVVQSFPSKQKQAQGLLQLLSFVKIDVDGSVSLLSASVALKDTQIDDALAAAELSQVKAMEVLSCLRGIGKAMQVPNDEDHALDLDDSASQPDFWVSGEGAPVQQQILSLLSEILKYHSTDSELVDLSCDVLRAGFPEAEPGPFVFPADLVIQFTSMGRLNGPGAMSILNLMQALPRAYMKPRIDGALATMLQYVLAMLRELSNPRNDPEDAEALLRTVGAYMPRYTNVLLQSGTESVAALFSFAGAALIVPEPLPKRAAIQFWEELLSQPASPETPQETLNAVVFHFAPSLAHAVMTQITGDALRSDLEGFSKLIFRFMKRVPNAKNMFDQALSGIAAVETLKPEVKRMFVGQLPLVKGYTKMKEVVMEFWLRCKGIPDYT